ncbi:MAG: 1-phosphofructokinase [Bacilli bacterium]
MIYTLTLNPSMDYYIELPSFKEGMVNRIAKETRVAGGKGINVSLVLRHYNVSQTALGFIGGSVGKFVSDTLEQSGVPTAFTQIAGETRINVKMRAETETELNSQGPTIEANELAQLMKIFDCLQADDIVVLAGSIPASLPQTIYAQMTERIIRCGATFAVDTTKEAMLSVLAHAPLLIKPNHHELGEIFDVTIHTMEEAIPYAKQLHARGAKNVVISFAGEGALLVNEEGVFSAKPPVGTLVNSVGAGDSLVAGFIGSIAQGRPAQEAFRYAVTTGSASAYQFGLCTATDIERLLPEVKVTQLS